MFISRKRVDVVSKISPIRSGYVSKNSVKMRHTLLYRNVNIYLCSLKSSGLPYWMRDTDYFHLVVLRVVSSYVVTERTSSLAVSCQLSSLRCVHVQLFGDTTVSFRCCCGVSGPLYHCSALTVGLYISHSLCFLCDQTLNLSVWSLENFSLRLKCSHATSCTGRHILENNLFLFWPWLRIHNKLIH